MIPSCPSYLARVAEVSVRKVFKLKRLKIVIPKQMFQRFPIALAQVKGSNTTKNLLN